MTSFQTITLERRFVLDMFIIYFYFNTCTYSDVLLILQIKRLIQSTNRVRTLRSQFPMSDNRQDYVEQAIDTVVKSKQRIIVSDLDVLMTVKMAHEAYDESQRDIRNCDKTVSGRVKIGRKL